MSWKSNRIRWILVAVVAIVAAMAVGAAVMNGSRRSDGDDNVATVAARRGRLTISVTESGTIKPLDQRILKSQVEGQTTIIFLVPEGNIVEKDELLVELDASKLEDQKVDQLIREQNTEAAFIRSRENVEVVKSQGESDVSVAKLDYQFAQEDLKQYLDGEYPKLLKEAESKMTLGNGELKRAAEEVEWSATLLREKYISESEHEQNKLAHRRAELDHELAVDNRDLLRDFTYKRKVTELKSDIDQTKMGLDRKVRKARADNVQAQADLNAKQAEFKQQQAKLAKFEDQITKTKIRAPIAGMVVYASSAKGNWRGNAEPLDEGQSVRERQELIYLPTADAMISEIKVHESRLDKVSLNLPVKVTVDALPGRKFTGRVSKIAPLPDAASMWLNPDLKVYSTRIVIDGPNRGLRTGMSCQAQIIVERFDDAVYVPVQVVVRVGSQPTVYVKKGESVEPRLVELGRDNNRMAHIKSGLEEGELVLLTPPLSAATAKLNESESDKEGKDDGSANKAQSKTHGAGEKPWEVERAGDQPGLRRGNGQRGDRGEGRQRSQGRGGGGQADKMRKRFENMTPEQREQMRKQFQGAGDTSGGGQ